jgi:hypothetical protein
MIREANTRQRDAPSGAKLLFAARIWGLVGLAGDTTLHGTGWRKDEERNV